MGMIHVYVTKEIEGSKLVVKTDGEDRWLEFDGEEVYRDTGGTGHPERFWGIIDGFKIGLKYQAEII